MTAFVDTSGFYAFLDGTDPGHAASRDAFLAATSASRQLLTTSYVLHECWALVQARLGWAALDAWLDDLVPLCEVVWVDPALHALGAARCRQARERRLGLTDCVSIEVMRQRRIRDYVGRDEHFDREGFRAL